MQEAMLNSQPKIKAWRNKKYQDFIRSKPSLYSDMPGTIDDPIVAAHQGFGKKGTALKPPDTHCVPLLWSEHSACEHQKGGKWLNYESIGKNLK